MTNMELANGTRSWQLQFTLEAGDHRHDGLVGRRAALLRHRVANMPHKIGKENSPSLAFVVSLSFEEAYVQRAVQALLRDPSAKHLNGAFIALGGRWYYEWLHKQRTEVAEAAGVLAV